jgi:hypothetical protein
MEKESLFTNVKLSKIVKKTKYNKGVKFNKYLISIIIVIGIIDILLTYINLHTFFYQSSLDKNEINIDLSKYRRNDYMNVALATRSYDQISDYFISKAGLDNGYQLIKDGHIVPPRKDFPTLLGYIKLIRIGFTDWNETRAMKYIDFLKNNLKDKYNFEIVDTPDYLLFSFYGNNHNNRKYRDSIKIAIYEEGFIPSFNEEDYTFGVAHIYYLDRYFRKATLLEYLGDLKNEDFRKIRNKVLNGPKREKFCGAVINHERNEDHFREKFIYELNKYKNVDLGGEINNSIGFNVTNNTEFFSSYKFSIAFEKNSGDGYATGHIINSLLAGTIPIYYGDYLIEEYINPNTYILVRNEIDLLDKIEYIKEIDQNDELYKKYLSEDVLVDKNIVKKRRKEEIEYWSHIFRPDKYDAKRIDHIRFGTRKCYDFARTHNK